MDGAVNVWVGAAGGDDFRPIKEDRERGIRWFGWAHDNRHLLYVQDRGGDEDWHLYAIDLDTGTTRDLTPFEHTQTQIVAVEKRFPHALLISLNRRTEKLHDAYRLDLASGVPLGAGVAGQRLESFMSGR